ncbi:hypothetical protein NCCP28_45350 [Niallia sp. NCCP-28]|nr:hypothetical protein NCCP28_45350 [Niallia sp. NCCP-28]
MKIVKLITLVLLITVLSIYIVYLFVSAYKYELHDKKFEEYTE